jgi:hypothetical protein
MSPPAAIMLAAAMLGLLTAAIAAASPTPAIKLGRIAGRRVRPGYGETVRLGQVVAVSGTVTHPPARARIQLQGRTTAAWHALLSVSFRGENFTLHWHVRSSHRYLRQWVGGGQPEPGGGDGYALVVPAGTYQLRDGGCTGEATVSVGHRTVADTDCDFP